MAYRNKSRNENIKDESFNMGGRNNQNNVEENFSWLSLILYIILYIIFVYLIYVLRCKLHDLDLSAFAFLILVDDLSKFDWILILMLCKKFFRWFGYVFGYFIYVSSVMFIYKWFGWVIYLYFQSPLIHINWYALEFYKFSLNFPGYLYIIYGDQVKAIIIILYGYFDNLLVSLSNLPYLLSHFFFDSFWVSYKYLYLWAEAVPESPLPGLFINWLVALYPYLNTLPALLSNLPELLSSFFFFSFWVFYECLYLWAEVVPESPFPGSLFSWFIHIFLFVCFYMMFKK